MGRFPLLDAGAVRIATLKFSRQLNDATNTRSVAVAKVIDVGLLLPPFKSCGARQRGKTKRGHQLTPEE
jgi:hypothetical protein